MFDFEKKLNLSSLKALKSNFENGKKQAVTGLSVAGVSLITSTLGKGSVFVAKDIITGSKVAEMLTAFNFNVKFITGGYENCGGLVDQNLKDDFFSAISGFALGKVDFLIVLATALKQKVPSKSAILNSVLNLSENQSISLSGLIQKLVEMGYQRSQNVMARGEFSVKGDVLIISALGSENLFRIELFDDVVEKITEVNPETKKFVASHKSLSIFARDLPLENKNIFSLTDKVIFDEPKQIAQIVENFENAENFVPKADVFKNLPKKALAFMGISASTFFKPDEFVHFSSEVGKNYYHNLKEFAEDLKSFQGTEKQIFVFCKNAENKARLQEFLEANFVFTQTVSGQATSIVLVEDFLPSTVFIHNAKSIFFGTHNVFGKQSKKPQGSKAKIFVPKVNDYVVHDFHGIGKCIGLEKMKLSGYEKEYVIIEYAGGDKLYLPSEQASSLSQYFAREQSPKLNKLGGADFARVKDKVYKSVKEMAFDLLKLYAVREKSKGTVYPKDDYLMEQFEQAFMFDETPDQLRAIADIKADMESPKIMDRLVCGDVGFGKTEVALRAIYKAVLAGSQVAFLCPTTILAQQHYKTCLKRFEGFMVKTARFNRLMTKKEETEVLSGLKDGSINVVVGTHKLLSKKVEFKNLTLLVLDEEQRFGVEDKEKIKTLKNNIDVLSLSATPIPRTLHMSLTGIRDISVIETPPVTRQPVQTFVTEFDETVISRAIAQELSRGGQVLIVYNNIENIYKFASFIRKVSNGATVGVAHGQMPPKMLEDSIIKLYSGEYQILVSTTLIENGVDLPTANTLLVIDADRLGLSQAYQIRGRIGRSDKIAYAYFFVKENKEISQNAFKRLSALMENTALGSGIKIAMADLDIRGAGNVLGKEQSGNMQKVGYDLYYKLLAVALKDLKGQAPENSQREIKLNVAISAFVPETFVESEDDRLKMITEISGLCSREEEAGYLENLQKVYGSVPQEIKNLTRLSLLKNWGKALGVKQINITENGYKIYFYDAQDIILDQRATILQNLDAVLLLFEKQNPQNS